MTADPIIRVSGLHKSFKRGPSLIQVLTGVDLAVQKGQGIAIVGASGTGKSTMLHLIGGLERPDSGSIYFGEDDICTMNESGMNTFRNSMIGFVFQFHYLLREFSALENVMMPSIVSPGRIASSEKRAKELLEIVGLKDRMHHKPGELSGGEQQRVAIARSLMMSPAILLADEPTGDLDPATGGIIIDLFTRLKSELGITMIVATHNMDLASIMDRVLLLRGGHLETYTS